MANYQEFLDSIDKEAYHAGEWRWEEDGFTVTRTYHYSPTGCHTSCGILLYEKDGKIVRVSADPSTLDEQGHFDLSKADGILFDQSKREYYKVGEKLGKAFSLGLKFR